ncbi:MAG: glutathione synthase [Polyangia bacterium]
MRILVVMDPPELVNPDGDTTLVIMMEALGRGHEVAICEPRHLELDGEHTFATVTRVEKAERARPPFVLSAGRREALSSYQVVLMRKDPPFDVDYFTSTLLLDRARGRTLVVNDPASLRTWNEKLAIFEFPKLIAETYVTRSVARLRELLGQLGGEMIVKPLDGAGGAGVFFVKQEDRNAQVIFESVSMGERKWVMAQRYLPAAREGDKRILLLDGEPIGSVLRVPRSDDNRGNLHVGGSAVRSPLSSREQQICDEVGAWCKQHGLYWVGLDVIGGHLTEVNITSPTGVQEINRLEGHSGKAMLESRFVDWIERRVA